MYGRHVGSLTVFTQERDSGWWFNDWDLSGNQGDQWSFASVEIPYHEDLVVCFITIYFNYYVPNNNSM